MEKIINKTLNNLTHIYRIVVYILAVSVVVYFFPKGVFFKYEFQKGKPWQYENYYAPFDFAIQKLEEEITLEKEQIVKNTLPIFNYNHSITEASKNNILNEINSILKYTFKASFAKSAKIKKVINVLETIYEVGYLKNSNQKEKHLAILLKKGTIVEEISHSKLYTHQKIEALLDLEFSNTTQTNRLVKKIISDKIQPNLFYDKAFSERNLNEKLNAISYTKGFVSKNEIIILKGHLVEGEKLAKLNSIKGEFESKTGNEKEHIWIIFGDIILVGLCFLMLLLFIKRYRPKLWKNTTSLNFIFFNSIGIILLYTLVLKYNANYIYVVPMTILPLLLKAFYDARLGLIVHVLTVLVLGLIVPNSFEFVFLQIISGVVTILTISEIYRRANLFLSVIKIVLIYSISYTGFTILKEAGIETVEWNQYFYFLLNGAATLFVLPLLYIYEKLFGLVSDESLKELINTNSPLLMELATKTPGTFQHSVQVAGLAEAVSNEINANTLLVKAGALYHDVGKISLPSYFTENQYTNVNPHDNLPPRESAAIIKDHIIKGVEIAKKNKLPERIIDFIRTHHGTTLVYYFYKKEMNLLGEVDEQNFRYPGPIPFSKETAILMMCDAVEAASKSIKQPTALLFDELVENIINNQMKDGQFMNADITFKEIGTAKKVLKKRIKNLHHIRIEYPK